jgi:putative thiazole-containing bacteriocin maturation protein
MIMTTMRPKLTGDTFYIPLADGVYFRNNQRAFKIKGKMIYRWMEKLAPYLEGQHTLEEITDGLDPQRRAMVTDLVTTLQANHFLKDTSHDLPHTLSALERETYAPEIAFIDSFCDSAASRFERFRNHQVLVIGSGLTLRGLVHASLKCGLRHLAVVTTHEGETHTQRHQEYLDRFHQGDPEQTLREIAAPDWSNEAEVLTVLQPFDTIVHISDQPMLARTRMLNRLCVTHAKNFLQATVVEDHAWIGPLVRPEVDGCWECAWRRLQGNLANRQEPFSCYDFRDQTAVPPSRCVALPTAALIANQLGFELFKSVTEAGPVETAHKLMEVDLETLRSQSHPFLPHPLCQACQHPVPRTEAAFVATMHQLEQGEPLDQDVFSQRAAPCFETRLGLFRSLDEDDFVQLPLSVCKAVVSEPMPQEHLGNPPTVLGRGSSFRASRLRATLRACEVYACRLVDRRRLPSREMQQELPMPAERFLCEAPLAEVKEWVWASDLQSGQACLVPAALIYPALRGLSPDGETRLGLGSGMSWAEALSRGLLSLCQHLTVAHLRERPEPYPQVDLATTPLEPEGTWQRHALAFILEKLDEILTVYDVTGPLQVPTLAFCLGEKIIAYHAQFTVAQALREGLETALITWQLAPEQTPVVPAPPELPFSLRGSNTSVPSYEVPQDWSERLQWLLLALQKQQWRAFAVPLDHDPALREVLPYLASVFLGQAEMSRKGVRSL